MASPRKRLGELLISLKLVTQQQLQEALEVQRESPAPLGSILVSLGYLTEDLLLNALAAQMGVSPWRLDERPPRANALGRLPAHICRTYQVLPVEVRGDLLILAMRNPLDLDALDLIRNVANMRIEPVLTDADRLMKAVEEYHGGIGGQKNAAMDKLVLQAMKDFDVERVSKKSSEKIEEDTRPVIGLVNQVLSEAIRLRASDVHIEPRDGRVDIRYRVDGQMRKIREIPAALLPMLTTRLKIMAELDIVEFRVPQDGRMSVEIDGRTVDLRVSVLPNHHGQRIVLRILDKSVALKKLEEIGFEEHNLNLFRNLITKPYGILLVTGPTGSGKTTTLYAALGELRNDSSNIMTCEDPIEYDIDGVNQSQVNEKVGLTFASQLRAILRQDPDIVLVGEIRDGETAQTAIRASLTGHLVMSTLHCNDAPSSIPRLLDMGTDPFLLSTSLIGVMSQRLLRVLCPDCKRLEKTSDSDMEIIASLMHERVAHAVETYHPVGCPKCSGTGYAGRTAVHEIMPVTAQVARAISGRESIDDIREAASHSGYQPMQVGAVRMVLDGRTTMAEARRFVFFETHTQEHEIPQLRVA